MKRVLIAGSSGMIGSLILENCLISGEVEEIISLVRKPSGRKHEKLNEITLTDFKDYSGRQNVFRNIDAAFFCIGVYTGQVPDNLFKIITVDYAVAFAEALLKNSPEARFCLLSGSGADKSEKSRFSFARYKGMAENQISGLGFKHFHSFRPAYIYPVTLRKEPNVSYRILRFMYPLIRLFGKRISIRSTDLAKSMFKVGLEGSKKSILENRDILKILRK